MITVFILTMNTAFMVSIAVSAANALYTLFALRLYFKARKAGTPAAWAAWIAGASAIGTIDAWISMPLWWLCYGLWLICASATIITFTTAWETRRQP